MERRRRSLSVSRFRVVALFGSVWTAVGISARADPLLNDTFADGSRLEAHRPAEAQVWVGREQDATVARGALSTTIGETSQKVWTYFTQAQPVTLTPGQKLTASVSFIPRQALSQGMSRGFRIGVFHDPTDPRVEDDVNDDSGGSGAPWTDAQGYAVQVLLMGGDGTSTKPFDLGKRTNLASPSLLGTSGDYLKMSGGTPVTLKLDTEYRVTLEISKVSDKQVDLTASLHQGNSELSTFTVSDDGSWLGSAPICDKFDFLFIRIANSATTADQIDFTNFKVELSDAGGLAN